MKGVKGTRRLLGREEENVKHIKTKTYGKT